MSFCYWWFCGFCGIYVWNVDFVCNFNVEVCYEVLVVEIEWVLVFMMVCGVEGDQFFIVDFYVSYEVLFIDYEYVMMWIDLCFQLFYDCFGYLLWIGEWICQIDGVYVEFLCYVCNLLGVKFGLMMIGEDVVVIVDVFDFDYEFGCLIFII